MRSRTKSREIALQILYQIEITGAAAGPTLDASLIAGPQEPEVADFARVLIEGALAHAADIGGLLKKYVKNWDVSRMAVIDRNILRMACFELLYLEGVPPKVAINEAIELAKRFGDVDSPRFVNGILDKIYKTERSEKS